VPGLGADANHANILRIPVEGDSGHFDRAREAFEGGKVRYQIVGGIGSHVKIWGHATFLVDSLARARALLYTAGFIPSSDSRHVLIDSRNGWNVHLMLYVFEIQGFNHSRTGGGSLLNKIESIIRVERISQYLQG